MCILTELPLLLPEPACLQRVEQRGGGGTTCVRQASTFLALSGDCAAPRGDEMFTEEEAEGTWTPARRPARARRGETSVFLARRRRVFGLTYKRSNIFLSFNISALNKIAHQVHSVMDESALSVQTPGWTNRGFAGERDKKKVVLLK